MRTIEFKENGYYLLSNSGQSDQKIFRAGEDFTRFLFLILYLQSPVPIYNSAWYTLQFIKKGSYPPIQKTKSILKERSVELCAFSVSPNKFELVVRNLTEGYLSVYMHRVLTAYSKYFNAKYQSRGHVFSGPFDCKSLSTGEINEVVKKIHTDGPSEWSSKEDYATKNRWGDLLCVKHSSTKHSKS